MTWKIILYAVPGGEPFYRRFGFMRMRTAMAIFENNVAARARVSQRIRFPALSSHVPWRIMHAFNNAALALALTCWVASAAALDRSGAIGRPSGK